MCNRIREAREAKGISLESLAGFVGVSVQTLQRIETGRANAVTIGTLTKIAAALDSSVEDLFFS